MLIVLFCPVVVLFFLYSNGTQQQLTSYTMVKVTNYLLCLTVQMCQCNITFNKRQQCMLEQMHSLDCNLLNDYKNTTLAQTFIILFSHQQTSQILYSVQLHILSYYHGVKKQLKYINFVVQIGHISRHLKSSTGTGLNQFGFPLRQH